MHMHTIWGRVIYMKGWARLGPKGRPEICECYPVVKVYSTMGPIKVCCTHSASSGVLAEEIL